MLDLLRGRLRTVAPPTRPPLPWSSLTRSEPTAAPLTRSESTAPLTRSESTTPLTGSESTTPLPGSESTRRESTGGLSGDGVALLSGSVRPARLTIPSGTESHLGSHVLHAFVLGFGELGDFGPLLLVGFDVVLNGHIRCEPEQAATEAAKATASTGPTGSSRTTTSAPTGTTAARSAPLGLLSLLLPRENRGGEKQRQCDEPRRQRESSNSDHGGILVTNSQCLECQSRRHRRLEHPSIIHVAISWSPLAELNLDNFHDSPTSRDRMQVSRMTREIGTLAPERGLKDEPGQKRDGDGQRGAADQDAIEDESPFEADLAER